MSFLQVSICFSQMRNDLFELLNFINADSIKRTVEDLQAFGTRRADRPPNGNLEVAQYMVARLQTYGIENASIENFIYQKYSGETYTGYNVLGTIVGEVSDSTVIIGAHLDCMNSYNSDLLAPAPGADDNASGCAQTIEMARIFFEKDIKPRYNIDFMAYDFEEFGLRGARYDAQKRNIEGEKIVVMLNNDMVGFQPVEEEWKLSLYWYDNSLDINNKAMEYCQKFTAITPLKPDYEDNYEMRQRSDSYAYFEQDFKTTFNIEYTFSPYYHQYRDSLVYLNFEYQKQVAHLNLALLLYYSKSPFELNINNRDYSQLITVSPNPATDVIRVIHYDDIEVSEIQIYNMVGSLLEVFSINGIQPVIINLQKFNKGIYILKINTNKGTIIKKIIKQ